MNSINQLGTTTPQQTQVSERSFVNKTGETTYSQTSEIINTPNSATMQVSSLSRLLNDAAVRAETRDAITNRDGLAAIAQSTAHELYGESYTRNKAIHDAEVPNSDDSQRLAQAKQATTFTNGQGSNPFKGMSRDQLALIAYDDSGAFTVNERRAALSEADDQEYQWRVKVVAKMMDDYNRTGKISAETHQEVLDHYKSLPAIEESQLPKGYDMQLQGWIQEAKSTESSQHKDELESLLEQLTKRLTNNQKS